MRFRKLMRRAAALILSVALVLVTAGCGNSYENAVSLAEPVTGSSESGLEGLIPDAAFRYAYLSFASPLFRNACKEKPGASVAVSPLSVMFALGMLENGASGETLEQMETMLGLPRDRMNRYLSTLIGEWAESRSLQVDDSVWLKDTVAGSVKQSFLDMSSKAYRASVFKAPFDSSTVRDINIWVSKNTDGMIENLMNRIDPDISVILVNTVLFDQDWSKAFEKGKTEKNADFRDGNGQTTGKVDLMTEKSGGSYYRDELCTVVDKLYKDDHCRFRVFQPADGVSIDQLLEAFTPEYYETVNRLSDWHRAEITLQMPKFKTDYRSDNLKNVLVKMGMEKAFTDGGFTEITEGVDYSVGFVVHQVHVEVDEEGTRAAAATGIGAKTAAMPYPDEITVRLDRPFVYMIMYDYLPVFMGVFRG